MVKKILVITAFLFAVLYHFIFYFQLYGPLAVEMSYWNSTVALVSSFILVFLYFSTNWRADLKNENIRILFDLLMFWVFINYFRSLWNIKGLSDLKELLLGCNTGLTLFPLLFFLVGVTPKYFPIVNRILFLYCMLIWVFSLFFISHLELQLFLLIPIFYIIITFPLQTEANRALTFMISVTVVLFSLSNRAGILRILISYFIVAVYYLIHKLHVSKRFFNIMIFCILTLPFYFLYQGINGKNIFRRTMENRTLTYGQHNLVDDTRTFLYYEVLHDLKMNKSFLLGKGVDAGYSSKSFQNLHRTAVEVGFLQLLLKTGIIGFLLYLTLIITAIFSALGKSRNLFMKYLGLLLTGYLLMLFVENILSFNLFNITIWLIVGMCHSEGLRNLNDQEILKLFRSPVFS